EAADENRPGPLEYRGQRQAVCARQVRKRLVQSWRQRLLALGLLRACIALRFRCDEAWRFEAREISTPGGARGILVLPVKPAEIGSEIRKARQGRGVAIVPVQSQQIAKEDRARPAVAQKMMLGKEEAIVVGAKAQERRADQRCLVHRETLVSVHGFDLE